VPRGTKASKALPIANSKVSGDKSFADDSVSSTQVRLCGEKFQQ